MAFDFKKEYSEYYLPKGKPQIVMIPRMNYVAVRGVGDPNAVDGDYKRAISILYTVAYTLRMSYRGGRQIEGFFEYVVPPLEGLWWQDGIEGIDISDKESFNWISMIRLPDFIRETDLEWAIRQVDEKKGMDCSAAKFFSLDEGLCVQMMHIGSYDDESRTIDQMHTYLSENGYITDFTSERRHHEIYLSDARKVAPERRRTVIRHPILKKGELIS